MDYKKIIIFSIVISILITFGTYLIKREDIISCGGNDMFGCVMDARFVERGWPLPYNNKSVLKEFEYDNGLYRVYWPIDSYSNFFADLTFWFFALLALMLLGQKFNMKRKA